MSPRVSVSPSQQEFTQEELLHRACLRVAGLIRGMHEERGSSDTRLLCDLLIPDRLITVGRSLRLDGKAWREHVVPRRVIILEAHAMLERKESDETLGRFIATHNVIVLVTPDEARRLDRKRDQGLRQEMPKGWAWGGDIFARLEAAKIEWEPLLPHHPALRERQAAVGAAV